MEQALDGRVITEKGQQRPVFCFFRNIADSITLADWGNATEEEVLSGKNGAMWEYLGSKILAEKAAWKFAEDNPTLDMSTSKI
jgi:hypothetical protein